MNEIDFGKRILSVEEAMQLDRSYTHDGIRVVSFPFPTRVFSDPQKAYTLSSLALGTWFTKRPGCERDLGARKTLLEIEQMADAKEISKDAFWYIDSSNMSFKPEEVTPHFATDCYYLKFRFKAEKSCENCIKVIGEDRLREVIEAGYTL